jgi:serine/threonine protein phosphatase PrpC
MPVRVAALTEQGGRRANEDDLRHGRGPNGHYAVLADGAGGHARGAEASRRAVECVRQALEAPGVAHEPQQLTAIIRQAHALIRRHQDSVEPESRMHTTIVALWLDAPVRHALWSNVGDSRLYRVRRGRAEVVTEDDSFVQQMVRSGLITAEQSRQHPQKNHLFAALGIEGEVDPHTVSRPVELRDGDAFLLASDGWWDSFTPEEVAATLAGQTGPKPWLETMRQRIVARNVPRQDNFSAVAVWIGDVERSAGTGVADDTLPRAQRLP